MNKERITASKKTGHWLEWQDSSICSAPMLTPLHSLDSFVGLELLV
jgi:hypothetical protein